jgi:hypothetical protein
VTSPRQLVRVLHRAQTLVNVYRVRCLPTHGNGFSTASFEYLPEKIFDI